MSMMRAKMRMMMGGHRRLKTVTRGVKAEMVAAKGVGVGGGLDDDGEQRKWRRVAEARGKGRLHNKIFFFVI